MKPIYWVLIVVVVLGVIMYSMYSSQQRKLAQIEAQLIAAQQDTPASDGQTNFWDVIKGIVGTFGT